MTRLRILLVLLLPVSARACPNLLIGSSLAEGMAPYARADGFEVIARRGADLFWLRARAPRCVGIMVTMIGTNALPGMSEGGRWPTRRASPRWLVEAGACRLGHAGVFPGSAGDGSSQRLDRRQQSHRRS